MTKNDIRKEIFARLKNIQNREKKEKEITDKVVDLVKKENYNKIAIYLSFQNEVSTREIVKILLEQGKQVFVPITKENTMTFSKIDNNTIFVKDKFGILEPSIAFPETEFDVIFVPLVAFDENNNRLGRGKGYYDKFLQNSTAKKIGIAFSIQQVPFLPTEQHDIKLDAIIHS